MDLEQVRSLYTEHVVSFLYYRVGGQLSTLIAEDILGRTYSGAGDEQEVLATMVAETADCEVGGFKVLPLVMDRDELFEFKEKFSQIAIKPTPKAHSFEAIFSELVAPHLQDILGQELVDSVQKVFLKSVSATPDQPLEVRFYMGMQAIYSSIPDVWSELEFAEQVQELSRHLPQEEQVPDHDMQEGEKSGLTFESLVEQIIVADLADLFGRGRVMKTVLNSAQAKTEGIFYDLFDRFDTFVTNVLDDDFITSMFDSFWVEECRKKWIRQAKALLG